MIYGKTRAQSTVSLLEQSEFVFHLTGSRFFGMETKESDWDFFVEWIDTLEPWLYSNGFRIDSESYVGDPMFIRIYKKDNVHVQIVDSAKIKEWVQYCLKPIFKDLKPPKAQAHELWSLGFKLYLAGMDGVNLYKIKRVSIPF